MDRRGRIDAIALTGPGQIRRPLEVARAHGSRLHDGPTRTLIASLGQKAT